MLFNSLTFLLFVLIVLLVYHAVLSGWRARKVFLLFASWFFYATWSPSFLGLLVATTWIDFQLADWIFRTRWSQPGVERPEGKRPAKLGLIASLAINLGVLAWFKYALFFYETAETIASLPVAPDFLRLAVPLGISFYTFHSISYIVDTYRGIRCPTRSFSDYALYVAFFPQLIAGPITRWGFFGPQLEQKRDVGLARIEGALFLLAVGYVKKVVCADSLGGFVDGVYAHPGEAGTIAVWIALYAYAFQIYFDFSGYTDIAMGVAGLLGFRLPENFRHPYLAENPSEFWRRWHISLSTWLRDYLYVPLGGNRRGELRTYVNLMVTMLLGGLWHGAAWTFVLWGGFHGAWLAVHRWWTRGGSPWATAAVTVQPRTPAFFRRFITFHLVALAWIPFRAGSLELTGEFLASLLRPQPLFYPFPLGPLLLVLIGFLSHGVALRVSLDQVWARFPRPVQGLVYGFVLVAVALFSAQTQRFIYFQF
ncbi:MAG: MBOAT family protein [Deltaproteobacteria bacterium]|nr:MBOAT family protein [Deltaproteobacteria bacterium]